MIIAMNKGTIYVGNIVVPNKDNLKEIRDALMQYENDVMGQQGFLPNYTKTEKNLATLRDVLSLGYSRDGDQLVYNHLEERVPNDEEIVNYTKETIRSNYLSTILLFTSLLGELDATGKESMIQKFIGMGIYKCIPFEEMWNIYNHELVVLPGDNKKISDAERNIKLQNLKVFRETLRLKLIQFEVEKDLSVMEYEMSPLSREYSSDDRYRVMRNSEIIFNSLKKSRRPNSKVS